MAQANNLSEEQIGSPIKFRAEATTIKQVPWAKFSQAAPASIWTAGRIAVSHAAIDLLWVLIKQGIPLTSNA